MANPWFAFYADDYDRDTADLNYVQDSAYGRLIRHYYRTGVPLPANAEQLHRICRAFADAERDAIDLVLHRYFHLEEDGWHNDRCDREIAKAREISKKRSNSAHIRHSKKDANAPASAVQMHTQLQLQKGEKFVLPVWIPKEAWDSYEVMRRRIRKNMTDKARQLAVKELEKLMNDGNDPEMVLNQSVLNSWQGLFPLKEKKHDKQTDLRDAERVASAYKF